MIDYRYLKTFVSLVPGPLRPLRTTVLVQYAFERGVPFFFVDWAPNPERAVIT
jgi:hypothetical protein